MSATNTVAPGFTSTIAFLIFSFSGVTSALSPTNTLSAGMLILFPAFGCVNESPVFTKSVDGITAVLSFFVFTLAFPFSSTSTVESGLTASTLALIASFSSGCSASGFPTTVLDAGVITSSPAPG